MTSYTYVKAQSLIQACQALKQPGAVIIAGGTDLMPRMRNETIKPQALVDLLGIDELKKVVVGKEKVSLGAGVKLAELLDNIELRSAFPELLKAIKRVASPQIRNTATLGGNLCQYTRCQFFNQSYHWRENLGLCYRSGGDSCFQRKNSPNCVASFYSDIAPILVALDAQAKIIGEDAERIIYLSEMYNKDGSLALKKGEILTAVEFTRKHNQGCSFLARNLRRTIDFSIGIAAVVINVDPQEKTCQEARIVLGAVAPFPYKAEKAEALLRGEGLNKDLIAEAAKLSVEDISPVPEPFCSPKYKKRLMEELVKRAIVEAYLEAFADSKSSMA